MIKLFFDISSRKKSSTIFSLFSGVRCSRTRYVGSWAPEAGCSQICAVNDLEREDRTMRLLFLKLISADNVCHLQAEVLFLRICFQVFFIRNQHKLTWVYCELLSLMSIRRFWSPTTIGEWKFIVSTNNTFRKPNRQLKDLMRIGR